MDYMTAKEAIEKWATTPRRVEIKKIPPAFFSLLVESFDNVAYFVGNGYGESWEAKRTWDNEKTRIPQNIINELLTYAKAKHGCLWLKRLLKK